MQQPESHSITALLQSLRSDDSRIYDDAAGRIWSRYFKDLLALAKGHLAPRVRRRVDEHDVVQAIYNSFCTRQRRGEYALADRKDLWRLLVAITENKTRTAATRHTRDKRDVRRELDPTDKPVGSSRGSPLDHAAGVSPTPAEAVILVEELQRRLEPLDPTLRKVALWKLEGYTNEEIAGAGMLDCTVRTVERKLNLIRRLWDSESQDAAEDRPTAS